MGMKSLPSALLVLLLFTLNLPAKDTAPPYIDPAKVDFQTLLPAPPANGSPETLQEIALILQKQQARTPEEVARIQREAKYLNVFLFDTVFGPWFTAKNLPVTTAFFGHVGANIHPVIVAAKTHWNRPRPFLQDHHVLPPIDLPKDPSYPSGHSTAGNLEAMILAQMAPDLKDALLARGAQIGDDRVLGGVHFPSDVAAGKLLANALMTQFMASPAFQADLAKAKAELDAARANQH